MPAQAMPQMVPQALPPGYAMPQQAMPRGNAYAPPKLPMKPRTLPPTIRAQSDDPRQPLAAPPPPMLMQSPNAALPTSPIAPPTAPQFAPEPPLQIPSPQEAGIQLADPADPGFVAPAMPSLNGMPAPRPITAPTAPAPEPPLASPTAPPANAENWVAQLAQLDRLGMLAFQLDPLPQGVRFVGTFQTATGQRRIEVVGATRGAALQAALAQLQAIAPGQ
ncbi:hypothetical protein [Tuwongella immobilis]|uniref:Uncharacterized protein n=1 Tax=Tuwongella immobilis TaxID=692036 RepID=A0A6C2YVN4_9BACT|nr:hypothetical protein [Tuwongella immobilis]VIP05680.1 unnamed protein product [Tuwongella immobilis]VTS08716.1 unnamed protein product [Tuwongella immobilis]